MTKYEIFARHLFYQLPVAEFIDPDWGDKVNTGIGLWYRPARLHGPAGRYDNPIPEPELTLIPQSGDLL
jgi:hypothetical protein